MKNILREKYKKIRNSIINKDLKDKKIFEKLINNSKVKEANTILIYVSTNSEINTYELIKYFLKTKKVAVPKIENKKMNFYYIESLSELKEGYFGIFEPATNNKVKNFSNCISITPGICFSKDGYRIGYGGGYYDKFYSEHNIYSIGLCYKECLVDDFEIEKFDKKVNEVITD